MRILYVTQVSLDGNTGATRHVQGITGALAALGHQVELVALRLRSPARRRPLVGAGAGMGRELLQALAVAGLTARRRPDVACVRICPSTAIVPAVLELGGIPTVLELNGPILDELGARGRGRLARAIVRALLTRVVRHSGPLVVPLASIGDWARDRLGARQVEVVESGCDLAIAVPAARAQARSALGLPADRPCVAFTGTLAPEQRLDLLVAAADVPGVTVLVAGDGHGRERIAAAAAGRPDGALRCFGAVAHERAIEIIRAAEVCLDLKPAHVGLKCLEYAALGRRIVAFEAPGADRLRRLYPGHEVLFPLRQGTAAEVRDAVTTAIAVEAAGPLSPEAVARARRDLGWETTARQLARVLESRARAPEPPARRGARHAPSAAG